MVRRVPASRVPGRLRTQRGQAATEMAAVSAVLAAALLLPWLDGESPAQLLLGAFVGIARAYEFWLYLL